MVHDGVAYFGWAKVGKWGDLGVLVTSQGHFMRSDNILREKALAKIHWSESIKGARIAMGIAIVDG